MFLDVRNQLHGTHFRGTAEGSCREGVDIRFHRIAIIVYFTADTGNQMDHMAVVLHLFVEIDLYVVCVAA